MAITTKNNNNASVAAATVAAAKVAAVLPAASATSNAVTAAPIAPVVAVLAAARTSAAQANAWHAVNGSTMPPANLPLAIGPTAPKGKVGGTRYQHGTALQAACAALGKGATVATVAAWCKAQGAKVPGCQGQGAMAGAVGNIRCALGQGVITAWA